MSGLKKIPNEYRKAIDLIKSDLVESLFDRAKKLEDNLKDFKKYAHEQIEEYMKLLAEEYKVSYEGKGNISLTNYDNTIRISKSIHDFIVFDEKLQIAKSLIDKCIHKWSNGADPKIKVLVDHAFEVDKQGKVSTDRVLGLRRLHIEDEDWNRAMQAITDSLSVINSKSYIRIHKRADEYSEWVQVNLNLANA